MPKSVTHVPGMKRHLCLGKLKMSNPETWVTDCTVDMGDTFALFNVGEMQLGLDQ